MCSEELGDKTVTAVDKKHDTEKHRD